MKTWDLEIEVEGSDTLVYQTIARPEEAPSITIGSSALADVVVPSATAQVHCALFVGDDGAITVVDRGSATGTAIAGRPIAGTVALAPGEPLEIGEAVLRVRAPVPSAMTWKLSIAVVDRGGWAKIEPPGQGEDGDIRVFHKAEVIVGRGRGADLVIRDGNVSRRHCSFHVEDDGTVWLRDRGSTNGLHVNAFRVDHAKLSLHDVVHVGDYRLRIAEPPKRVPC